MKVKQYIYHWLFFPLLAILLASGTTGCSNESVMEEEDTLGKTTLSITVRGVTITDGNSDEYIQTLRIIGFDENDKVVCNKLHSNDDLILVDDVLNITETMEDAFQGGVCDFYFIANEKTYSVFGGTDLFNFLNSGELNKSNLESCHIATPSNQPFTPSETTPILMTTSVRTTLKPGDNTINNIKLVRCFAKVQLKIIDKTNSASVGNNLVLGTYPGYYSLWDESQDANWTSNDREVNISLSLEKGNIEQDEQFYDLYTSQEIYFPERLFTQDANTNTEANALKFSFTLNNNPYTVAVADATGTDFNIRRNTHYTVIATLKKKETVTFNVMVNAWGEKKMDVPAFE